jgi:hypothetical protein
MRLISLLALLVFSAGCAKTKSAGDATTEFWTWFAAHSAEYASLFSYEQHAAAPNNSEREKLVAQAVADTASRLRRINPEFSPFFGYSNGTNKLIITVGGQKEFFAAADQLVFGAPKIPGWTFIALKPPQDLDGNTEIKSGSVSIKLGDMRYTRQPQGDGSFAFTVFVPFDVSSDPDGFRRLCSRLIEDSLGERLAATAIRGVEVRQLDATSKAGLFEFIHVHREISNAGP